ncbi:MAG: hypothetical protein ABTD50_09845 [Polyangiaceae bacterium]|jgi:hypothetical protein
MRRHILEGSVLFLLVVPCSACSVTATLLSSDDSGADAQAGEDASSLSTGQDASLRSDGGAEVEAGIEGSDGAGATRDVLAQDISVSAYDGGAESDAERETEGAADAPSEATCSLLPDLVPDAAPHTCALSPADVACTSDTDCTSLVLVGCGCAPNVWGVNMASTATACYVPCAVPVMPDGAPGCAPGTTGFETQDCELAPDMSNVGVRCVEQQCVTFTSTTTGVGAADASGGSDGASLSDDASNAGGDAACTAALSFIEANPPPQACAFTPAEVACSTDEDCTTYGIPACGCVGPVVGVNTTNTKVCVAPPCAPPVMPDGGFGCAPDASGYETEDCQTAPDFSYVGVRCVDQQCMTFTSPTTVVGALCRAAGGTCRTPVSPCTEAPSSDQDCETNPPNPGGFTCCL